MRLRLLYNDDCTDGVDGPANDARTHGLRRARPARHAGYVRTRRAGYVAKRLNAEAEASACASSLDREGSGAIGGGCILAIGSQNPMHCTHTTRPAAD